ncbi:hypothetical protein [Halococcoides cellulosivorans]|uniref:hypothetical protein n=1 Tax=Halococcoides cellulosivorans TaxID=1679096 RepID=UPI001F297ECD|nr:hypothetical protein [Halococcoides cellulosivorans]
MNQVAARARYEAQRAFPEEDILPDLWNPEFLKRGVEALSNYSMSAFNREFRPFYEALDDPWPLIDHDRSNVQDASIVVRQPFTITADNRIGRVADVSVEYVLAGESEPRFVGPTYDDFDADVVTCELIPIPFVEDYPYEDHFHVLVMQHLLAQVRDTYLHMGEQPPEAYLVDGPGKVSGFHGDGIRRDPDEIHVPDDYDFTIEFPDP